MFCNSSIRGISENRSSRALVQPQASSKNILVSFSTQAGQLAKDDVNNRKHSPYAIALSEKLKLKKDIRLVMGGVKDRVLVLSSYAQEPISRSSLGEDVFCLVKGCRNKVEQVRVVEKIVYRDREVEPIPAPVPKPIPVPVVPTSKWLKPTNSVCKANWENAEKICSASGGKLPSRADLKKVVVDCGGSFTTYGNKDWDSLTDKNIANKSYQSCLQLVV